MMQNALRELKENLDSCGKTTADIEMIGIAADFDYQNKKIIIDSKEGIITLGDIAELDFEYDDGYGGQELFGYVVFKDGTWLSRAEYDGSEWWEYNKTPTYETINKEFIGLGLKEEEDA
jgi:hypothetical protein